MRSLVKIIGFAVAFLAIGVQAEVARDDRGIAAADEQRPFRLAALADDALTSPLLLAGNELRYDGKGTKAQGVQSQGRELSADSKCDSGCSLKGGMCICGKPSGGCSSGCNETQDGKCRCPQNKSIGGGRPAPARVLSR